jgi:biotin/methionine sulfoxide reductase
MVATKPATAYRRHASHWGAFTAEVHNGRLIGVSPFEHDDHPSPFLESIPDGVYAECRITQPMIREGWLKQGAGGNREQRGAEPFVPVAWDTALDLVAAELQRVKQEAGNEAIFAGSMGWSSAGKFHHAKTQLQRFMNGFGGFTNQVHNYSIAAGLALLPHIIGGAGAAFGPFTSWPSIAAHTKLMVCFGGLPLKNVYVEPGGSGEHTAETWLRRAHANGCEFVSISPLRHDSADFLHPQRLYPRPNTDVTIMLALAYVLITEGLHNRDFLGRYCTGYERFEPYVLGKTDGQPKTPEWAGKIADVEAEAIRTLARRMAQARTMITCSYALQRGDHGEQPYWMTVVLGAMLGQIGLPGGGFGTGYGSMAGMGNPVDRFTVSGLPTGPNPTGSFIPAARISDMLLHPGESYQFNGMDRVYPHIKLIYWSGGNPFHHHQDLNRLVRAWQRPDTIIVHEPWWTSTARYADIVLPATTTLERNDLGASSRDRFILAMQQVVEPLGAARNDFDIFSDLAERLGFKEAFTAGRDAWGWIRHLYNTSRRQGTEQGIELPDFETFWAQGFVELPPPSKPYIIFEHFRNDPEAHPLQTPSGKIEIFSETIDGFGYDDCPGHPVWLEPVEWLGGAQARHYPLHMISNQPRTRLHSQMDHSGISRRSKIRGREPMTMHPADAAARGLQDGDVARVFNDRGEVLAGVVVSDHIRPGVVELPTGAWYDPLVPGMIGALDKHGNPNVLTMDKGTSKLAQGPIAHSALVEVERFDGELPDITVFAPPPIKEP